MPSTANAAGLQSRRRYFFSDIPENLSILAYIISKYLFIFADMKQNILYTPTEIITRNPRLKKVWTAQDIGYLFKLQLVDGERRSRYALLNEDDVLRLFYFRFPKFVQ